MNLPIILNSKSIVSRNSSNIISNVLHDEIVIMDLKNGNYLNLNQIGSSIWDLLESPISINALIHVLLGKYEVEESECHAHVVEFLHTLQQHGLLVVQSNSN